MAEDSRGEDGFTVEAEREIDAPPAVAWRSWTDSDVLSRWWGPSGFTCPTARMDVRVSGVSLVSMAAPDWGFPEMFSTWTYTVVDEPHRLEFTFRFADAEGAALAPGDPRVPPGVPAEVAHVITFEGLPSERTRMRIVESGYETAEPLEMSRQGLEQSLDKLLPLFRDGEVVD
ncbi:SRPBCC family protein [Microbacterium terricola]|uniref:ATPase n=1 Tax=Microbacterium terricola TaxID=344163 RepID=A0ABM8E1B4_9MICO|nr:SRPBCC domain-containing protein [Microbacterium terricola]UYK40672.1 SRPBCC domain-containing protein [Microbacterium terricola]BDV31595.1 ATPase [Microbacterium terricola]